MTLIRRIAPATLLCLLANLTNAEEAPRLNITWPQDGMAVPLGAEGVIGVVVDSNFRLAPAGSCGDDLRCGHVHMKIDPDGDSCNVPDRPYNSMNSDFGGTLITARFGHCPSPKGDHVIGALLANDHHQPVLFDGKPVTALVRITTE